MMNRLRFGPGRRLAALFSRPGACGPTLLTLPLLLAACASSAPVHYYTLLSPASQAHAALGTAAPFLLDVQSVNVSAQADQPQLMLRTGDGSVTALYSARWSSPLGDEIRGALSDALKRDLGALDAQGVKPGPAAPIWRVQTDVQRFDLAPGHLAQLDVTWRVRPLNVEGTALLCRSVVTETVSEPGVPALVVAQQRAVAALAGVMASAIRGQTPASAGTVQMLGCTSRVK